MNAPRSSHPLALVGCATAVVAWGSGPLMVHAMSVDTPAILFWRFWVAIPLLVALARYRDRSLTLGTLLSLWRPGLLFGGSFMLGFASYRSTSIANATLISSLTPLVVMLVASRLFGERPTARMLALTATAVGGIVLVVVGAGHSSGASLHGDLLAGGSLVCFSAYFMLAKRHRDAGVPTTTFLAGVFLTGGLAIAPVCLIGSHDIGHLSAKDYTLVVSMVLLPGLVGHGLITWSQQHLAITTSSLMTLANPMISTLLAWWIEHQNLGVVQGVGIAVVIAALVGVVFNLRAAPATPLPEPA